MVLRVLPFIAPDRKRRDEDAGFEQHIKGDIGHVQFRGQQASMFSAQQNGHHPASLSGRCVPRARLP